MNWWPTVLFAAAWPPAWSLATRRILSPWEITWAWTAALGVLLTGLARVWPATLVAAAQTVIGLFLYWWNRRRRGRARAWLGNKAKAIRAALVRKQREARKPRPVLRPVPGGAR